MEILANDRFPGAVAITDANFGRLEGRSLPPGVLLTDLHDLECMMLASPAWEKLLYELAQPNRIDAFQRQNSRDVLTAIARSAATVGYLRWASLRHGLSLKFEGLSFSRFLRRTDLAVDTARLIEEVKNHSLKPDVDASWLEAEIVALSAHGHDPWEVACGHDAIEILSFALRRVLAAGAHSEVRREFLERNLRLAYERLFFRKTKLWESLRLWQASNAPYRVLPHGDE